MHLHVASGCAVRCGASRPEALARRAAQRGMGWLALTGRDNVTGPFGSRPMRGCSRAEARNARVSARGVHPLTVHAP